jgi:cell wall-associated NlpC family hydrolase
VPGRHRTTPRHTSRMVTLLTVLTVGLLTLTAPADAASTSAQVAQRAVNAALSQRGAPYRHGGDQPGGFDCSGLTEWSFRQAGVTMPRTAQGQSGVGTLISASHARDARAGDLLFYGSGRRIWHVAMATGDGMLVESSRPGHPVAKRPVYTANLRWLRRPAG